MIPAMSMNRKQRRLQEKKAGKKSDGNKANPSSADTALAAQKKAEGIALKNAGKDKEAIPLLREALRLDSSLADVHFTLAMMARTKPELNINIEEINKKLTNKNLLLAQYSVIMDILRKRRSYNEVKICQEECCRLVPDDPMALMDLGLLQTLTGGGGEEAILSMSRALNMAPDNKIVKSIFATSLHKPVFSKFHPEIKEAMNHCLEDIYDVNLYRFCPAWIGLMSEDPLYRGFMEKALKTKGEDFAACMDSLDENSGAFLKDPYFIRGLRSVIVSFVGMEEILNKMRRYICLSLDELIADGRIHLFEQFICALAEQCFFNEYVYTQDEQETQAVEKLLKGIADNPDKATISLVACYQPLYRIMAGKGDILQKLAEGDEYFAHLVKTQFDNPNREEKLKKEIPIFGEFANEISRKVQSQYEENPYPRWVTISTHPLPTDDVPMGHDNRNSVSNILIAGCGTGRHALGSAIRYPRAAVTAIDLSRASIAYGMRKAEECGLTDRIKFVHADILSMADWPDEFDMIECSGVLHHMEDPFEGWKVLNSKLKPGGWFKIGLYSETARQQIVEAREFIAKNNYPATLEGIRACRRAIFDLPFGHPLKEYLLKSGDFFSTSLVRDLIFHVQEHRMTLPQIKGMMDKLGLQCFKFLLNDPEIVAKYDTMHPDDKQRNSIDNWTAFEEKYPLTFTSMYQFWCRKTG